MNFLTLSEEKPDLYNNRGALSLFPVERPACTQLFPFKYESDKISSDRRYVVTEAGV